MNKERGAVLNFVDDDDNPISCGDQIWVSPTSRYENRMRRTRRIGVQGARGARLIEVVVPHPLRGAVCAPHCASRLKALRRAPLTTLLLYHPRCIIQVSLSTSLHEYAWKPFRMLENLSKCLWLITQIPKLHQIRHVTKFCQLHNLTFFKLI